MREESAHVVPVLDYSPVRGPSVAATRARILLLSVVCALLASAATYFVQPLSYTSVGYLSVHNPSANVDGLVRQQHELVEYLRSNAPSVIARSTKAGLHRTPAQIASALQIRAIPGSRLIAFSYTDRDPQSAAGVATTAFFRMIPDGAENESMLRFASMPATPTKPDHPFRYPLIVGIATLLIMIVLLARSRLPGAVKS
jgi:uncharacterized protein involved in exopolysaccharide biosynthesis